MSTEQQKKETQNQAPNKKPFVRYDDYWLQKAREMIDGSLEALSGRLNTLDKFLNFLVAGAFIGGVSLTTYLQSKELAVYVFALIPLVTIGIAKYFVNIGGTKPAMEGADMRNPTDINENYAQILVTLALQVKRASIFVGIATAFTLVSLPFAVYFHNQSENTKPPSTYLSIQNDGTNLSLQGVLPDAKKVSVTLYGKDAKKKAKPPIYTDLLLQKPGELEATINLKTLKIVIDSLELNYTASKQKQRHTYRMDRSVANEIKPEKEETKVDSTKTITTTK